MSQIVVVFDVNPDCPRRVAAQALCDALAAANLTRLDTPLGGQPIESWWYADGDLKDIDRNDNRAMVLVDDDEPRVETWQVVGGPTPYWIWQCHRCLAKSPLHTFKTPGAAQGDANTHECPDLT